MPTSKYAARARLSALHRHGGPDDPAVAAARSVLREAKLFEEIAREAEADPPLSTEARARLAVLLERERWGDLLTYGAEPEECTRIVLAERAAKFALEVEGQAHRLRVREAAQRKIRTEQRRDVGNLDPIPLDRFLAIPDEPVDYRIAGLWPKGGRIVLAAQWKVGKTTLTGNVIRALADGALFLDRFQTQPAESRCSTSRRTRARSGNGYVTNESNTRLTCT